MICGKQFQLRYKKNKLKQKLWLNYVWSRQTVSQLALGYRKSEKWIRLQLASAIIKTVAVSPQPLVFIADATFFKRTFGILVFRSQKLKKNVYWKEVKSETIQEYRDTRNLLESRGFKFLAIVLDGKPGARKVFSDIPVQMCQFHQIAIVNRYLTTRPRLEASIELREIVLKLSKTDEESFEGWLDEWYEKWKDFLKEKTIDPKTGKWHYTHKRLRAAYRSLKTNLPYLFTYQKYPELDIPNTTNGLESSFSHLKDLVRIHRGISKELKLKIIDEILGK